MKIDKPAIADAIHLGVNQYLLENLTESEAHKRLESLLDALSHQSGLPKDPLIEIALSQRIDHTVINDVSAVEDFLRFYRITNTSKRRSGTKEQIKAASQGNLVLDSSLINEISLMQNRTRGKVFEMMGKILVASHFERQGKNGVEIVSDTATFLSVDSRGRKAKRRFDLYVPEMKVGVEIKSGRVHFNRFTRDQIHKDGYLLKREVVAEIWWFLFYGASKRVLEELDKHSISYGDLAFTDYE
jgi:hypothetical protein